MANWVAYPSLSRLEKIMHSYLESFSLTHVSVLTPPPGDRVNGVFPFHHSLRMLHLCPLLTPERPLQDAG